MILKLVLVISLASLAQAIVQNIKASPLSARNSEHRTSLNELFENPSHFYDKFYANNDPQTEQLCSHSGGFGYEVISNRIGRLSSPSSRYAIRRILNIESDSLCRLVCKKTPYCSFVEIDKNLRTCVLYSFKAAYFLKKSTEKCIFNSNPTPLYTFDTTQESRADRLQYYWPIVDSHNLDLISGANMFDCVNDEFSQDRFGVKYSSIDFDLGYCQLPPKDYLNNPNGYTISFWVKLDRIPGKFFPLLEMQATDGVSDFFINSDPVISLGFNDEPSSLLLQTAASLTLGRWTHVAFTYDGQKGDLYLNSNKIGEKQGTFWSPSVLLSSFIGKNPDIESSLDASYDELRIYGSFFSEPEIRRDFRRRSFLTSINF